MLRTQVTQNGDFVIIGNTLGQDCASGIPAPVVGTLGACGTSTADSAIDVFWRSDSPAMGQAEASTSISAAQARSTAVLNLPTGARVTHAYLYWAANRTAATNMGLNATLARPGVFSEVIQSSDTQTAVNDSYRSFSDITPLVQEHGTGAYQLGGIDLIPLSNVSNANLFAAWWMVVLYELDGDVLRNLAVFDGLDPVGSGSPVNASLSGFKVPSAAFDAKLGLVALEGDITSTGDSLSFNGTVLSNALNPQDNFFNSTRSHFGTAVSVVGDLPQTTGAAGSLSGMDIDVVDVKNLLNGGDTTAKISATSTGDVYYLTSFVTSIATYRPSLGSSQMEVVSLNPGPSQLGRVLEYSVTVNNTGTEDARNVVYANPLPTGVSLIPGSLKIAGASVTDAAGDDAADYNAATRTINLRLGAGANAVQGGNLAVNDSLKISYQVLVDALCSGDVTLSNQGTVSGVGVISGDSVSHQTDGDAAAGGSQPLLTALSMRSLSIGNTSTMGSLTATATTTTGVACSAPVGAVSYPTGSSIVINAAPTAPGAVFGQWSGDCAGATGTSCTVLLSSDAVVDASWTMTPLYSVSPVSAGGGTVACTPLTVFEGSSTNCTAVPAQGYRTASMGGCNGAITAAGVDNYVTGAVTSACTVTAAFELLNYSVNATANPPAGGLVTCTPATVAHGSAASCTAVATTGYVLTGWSGDCSGTAASCNLPNVTADRTVTAQFSIVQKSLSGTTMPAAGNSAGTAVAGFTGGGASCRFDTSSSAFVPAPATLPAGQTLPHGMLQFKLLGCDAGATVHMRVDWPAPVHGAAKYGKATAGASEAGFFAPDNLSTSGNTTEFDVTDGAVGDEDGAKNGEIVDPVGATVPTAVPVVAAVPVPTLGQWALVLLSMLAAGLRVGVLRRTVSVARVGR
ncbi:IPTL-CTERM sorting domain-containing protein [Diaphorobacter sp. HDW4A]|uniref:IPTL-CTERM sorting domain-containing protein n=1 Tax=Diaphorobacter sp. HDW4A TaxID=2714924 RepID=UPI001409E366|nr:IPTL-CTERM sorting domain-containing protein [Diaphorobacter sp. HDW4A]QIL78712.1 IPTL-CTERM sorting domain-containing protein [Diaphorobacter sp. HDW4A]